MSVRVFVAARVRLYREGLAEILARQEGIEVVGVAGDAAETLSRVGEVTADVVLFDPAIPESMDAIRTLVDPALGVTVVALASPETKPKLSLVRRRESLGSSVLTTRMQISWRCSAVSREAIFSVRHRSPAPC